jgi:Tfp pilus assembly protein FimT
MRGKMFRQQGITLLELLIALALAMVLMAGISSAISMGLQSKNYAHDTNEMAYSARFALSRIVANVRTAQSATVTNGGSCPSIVSTLTIRPTNYPTNPDFVYSLNAATNQLTEKVGAAAATVLADNVTCFAAQAFTRVPKSDKYGDMPIGPSLAPGVVDIDITLTRGNQSITVSANSRIGPI